jgi:hypothetical protein
VRSELTLDGRPVASIAVGGGTMGDEGVDFSLTRPFDIPAEFTVSLRAADERVQDGRLMVKLVRTTWWRLQDARAMVKLVKASW